MDSQKSMTKINGKMQWQKSNTKINGNYRIKYIDNTDLRNFYNL